MFDNACQRFPPQLGKAEAGRQGWPFVGRLIGPVLHFGGFGFAPQLIWTPLWIAVNSRNTETFGYLVFQRILEFLDKPGTKSMAHTISLGFWELSAIQLMNFWFREARERRLSVFFRCNVCPNNVMLQGLGNPFGRFGIDMGDSNSIFAIQMAYEWASMILLFSNVPAYSNVYLRARAHYIAFCTPFRESLRW